MEEGAETLVFGKHQEDGKIETRHKTQERIAKQNKPSI